MTPDLLAPPVVRCPLCDTPSAATPDDARADDGYWQCVTCGQNWTDRRLATVAAYAAWVVSHP